MDEGEPGQTFARLTLSGARFDEARLPVSSLVELQRYRQLIATAARERWVLANPGEDVPGDFLTGFDLVIDTIEPGSASAVLEINATPYRSFFDDGRQDIDSLFFAIVSNHASVAVETSTTADTTMHYEELDYASLDRITSQKEFKRFGSSLQAEEILVLPVVPSSSSESAVEEVHIQRTTTEALDRFAKDVRKQVSGRTQSTATVAGRLVAVDADRENYHVATLAHGKVLGKYDGSAGTLDDLKAVLNSSTQAPLIRITGRTSWLGSTLTRILSTDTVELLEIEAEPWSRRIIELASLTTNWDGDGAPPIEFSAIDAARVVLRGRYDQPSIPGIFPREDGGVVIEWSTVSSLLTLEIAPSLEMDAYYVEKGSTASLSATFTSVEEALTYVQEMLE